MAIRLPPPKYKPSKAELESVRAIAERYFDRRWAPYMIFKGEAMLEQGYSVTEIDECFSKTSTKV